MPDGIYMEVVLAPCRIPLTCSTTLWMQSYRAELGIDEVETWLYCVCACVYTCVICSMFGGGRVCACGCCVLYTCVSGMSEVLHQCARHQF